MSKDINNFMISDNFNLREFACPCCQLVKIELYLINCLQALRFALKEPIRVTSGYRCIKHNKAVGGMTDSRHIQGRAVDVLLKSCDDISIIKLARKIGFKYCYYEPVKCFYHLDIGDEA